MKRSSAVAFGAAVIATIVASSAAQAAIIDFFFSALDGSITYAPAASLDVSSALDLDGATMLVMDVGPGDASGLDDNDTIKLASLHPLAGSIISYGFGDKPSDFPTPLGADVILTWPMGPGPGADTFTETLTIVLSINRTTPNEIGVTLSGMISDMKGLFVDTPVQLIMTASQAGGSGTVGVEFTNTSSLTPSIPELSTWVMMAIGFAAIGYAAVCRPSAPAAAPSV